MRFYAILTTRSRRRVCITIERDARISLFLFAHYARANVREHMHQYDRMRRVYDECAPHAYLLGLCAAHHFRVACARTYDVADNLMAALDQQTLSARKLDTLEKLETD